MAGVLVIDDDAEIRATLRELLEDADYEVIEARDGVEGLRKLREVRSPLVVLVDLKMPRMDGEALLTTAAQDADLAQRHAYILVTANPDNQSPALARLLARLAAPSLAKPFEIDDVLALVARAAERARVVVRR